MDFRIYIPVKIAHKYLPLAVTSIEKYRDKVVLIDQTQDRNLNGFPCVIEKNLPNLKFSQIQNWIQQDALARGLDVFFYMHSDTECKEDMVGACLQFASTTKEKWGVILTNYDALACFNIDIVKTGIKWDEQFTFYRTDRDTYLSVWYAGFDVFYLNPDGTFKLWDMLKPEFDDKEWQERGVLHHHSQTLANSSPRQRCLINNVTLCEEGNFRSKWGGSVYHEIKPLWVLRADTYKDFLRFIQSELNSDMTVLEIGCWTGESTRLLAEHVKKVIAVDPWEKIRDCNGIFAGATPRYPQFDFDLSLAHREFLRRSRFHKNIEAIQAFDWEVALSEPVDFVYIDSIHTADELRRTITCWLPRTKKIGGHDYGREFPGVKQVVDSLFPSVRVYPDSSWAAL